MHDSYRIDTVDTNSMYIQYANSDRLVHGVLQFPFHLLRFVGLMICSSEYGCLNRDLFPSNCLKVQLIILSRKKKFYCLLLAQLLKIRLLNLNSSFIYCYNSRSYSLNNRLFESYNQEQWKVSTCC